MISARRPFLASLLALAALLPSGAFAAGAPPAEQPLRVLTSFLPVHVFTTNVTAGVPGIRVEMMLPAALGCPHDYSLSPSDMRRIAAADLFVVNGHGMEEFAGAPVRKANPKVRVVESARAVRPIRAEGRDGHGHGGVNPHTWVSPRNAVLQVREIERALSAASPGNAARLRANADAYVARLEALAKEMESAAARFRNRNVVTFHNVFAYLARDLSLRVVGEIESVPGQEPSAGELGKLVGTIRRTRAAAVFGEPQYGGRLAETVAREAGVPVRTLDPVATGDPVPTAYEDAMRRNLRVLVEALGS